VYLQDKLFLSRAETARWRSCATQITYQRPTTRAELEAPRQQQLVRETLDAFLNQQQPVVTELEKNIEERLADQRQTGQEASSDQHIINFLTAQV
jgi:hypothetical protein